VHCKRKYLLRTGGFIQYLTNHELLYFIFGNNSTPVLPAVSIHQYVPKQL